VPAGRSGGYWDSERSEDEEADDEEGKIHQSVWIMDSCLACALLRRTTSSMSRSMISVLKVELETTLRVRLLGDRRPLPCGTPFIS
jgi:hypothetical protein